MATFRAFIDESGADPRQSHFVLAGYLATVAQWEGFTEECDTLCRSWGHSDFHMTEAEARCGEEYGGWSEPERDARIEALASTVDRHTARGFACDIRRSVYTDFVEKAASVQPKGFAAVVRSPYAPMALFLLSGIGGECDRRGIKRSDVWVMFERRSMPSRERRAAERVCEMLGFDVPQFQSSADFAPLRAADMLAWRIYNNCKRRPVGAKLVIPQRHRPLLNRALVSRIGKAELSKIKLTIRARVIDAADNRKPRRVVLRAFPDGPITWDERDAPPKA